MVKKHVYIINLLHVPFLVLYLINLLYVNPASSSSTLMKVHSENKVI